MNPTDQTCGGPTNEWTVERTNRWTEERTKYIWIDEWTDGPNEWIDEWTDGPNEWTDGPNEWTDGPNGASGRGPCVAAPWNCQPGPSYGGGVTAGPFTAFRLLHDLDIIRVLE